MQFENSKDEEVKEEDIIIVWSARKLHWSIPVYVLSLYLLLIVIVSFTIESGGVLKALVIACVGTLGALVPGFRRGMEYKLTKDCLLFRHANNESAHYDTLFKLSELSHVKLIWNGFKYYIHQSEENPFLRFWKNEIVAGYSGTVNINKVDRMKVQEALLKCEVDVR